MSERAALVERMAQTIRSAWIDWEIDDTAGGKTYAAVAAEAALAAVEAAGWGPRPEAVTYTEVNQFGMDLFGVFGDMRHAFVPEIWDDRARTVLMSDVLRSRGITVEGAK